TLAQEGQAPEAIRLTCTAFDSVRQRWRRQRSEALGAVAWRPLAQTVRSRQPGLDRPSREDQLDDLLEVQPFANDMGEYFWFRAARLQHENGLQLDLEDARRAVLFVAGWVVRWEVFDHGYPIERWHERWAQIEPPSVGDGETPQAIAVETMLEPEWP